MSNTYENQILVFTIISRVEGLSNTYENQILAFTIVSRVEGLSIAMKLLSPF